MINPFQEFIDWCAKHNKEPKNGASLIEFNAKRGFKSKYAGKKVLVKADGSIELVGGAA